MPRSQLEEACAAAVEQQLADVAAAAKAGSSAGPSASALCCSSCGGNFKVAICYQGRTLRCPAYWLFA